MQDVVKARIRERSQALLERLHNARALAISATQRRSETGAAPVSPSQQASLQLADVLSIYNPVGRLAAVGKSGGGGVQVHGHELEAWANASAQLAAKMVHNECTGGCAVPIAQAGPSPSARLLSTVFVAMPQSQCCSVPALPPVGLPPPLVPAFDARHGDQPHLTLPNSTQLRPPPSLIVAGHDWLKKCNGTADDVTSSGHVEAAPAVAAHMVRALNNADACDQRQPAATSPRTPRLPAMLAHLSPRSTSGTSCSAGCTEEASEPLMVAGSPLRTPAHGGSAEGKPVGRDPLAGSQLLSAAAGDAPILDWDVGTTLGWEAWSPPSSDGSMAHSSLPEARSAIFNVEQPCWPRTPAAVAAAGQVAGDETAKMDAAQRFIEEALQGQRADRLLLDMISPRQGS